MTKVLICDDEGARATELRQRLRVRLPSRQGFEVTAMSPVDFLEAIAGLESRQRRARDEQGSDEDLGENEHPFDSADMLLVDYDLVRLGSISSGATPAESGERVCYLARCYSLCGIIIGYNQFSYRQTFDLTLRGHLRSFADLNISMASAANSGLWGENYKGFRPWSWPLLRPACEKLNIRAEALVGRLDEPILATVGLDGPGIYPQLTREQLEFLTSTSNPQAATFREFVKNSGNGLRPRDIGAGPIAVARIAAARIAKWLERSILPHQNILVDAPHLVARFPSLVRDEPTAATLNNTCRLAVPRDELGLDNEMLHSAEFRAENWLTRPAWLWPSISGNELIAEVQDPWHIRDLEFVFCEDVSRFRPIREATEFVAEVAPEFGRRYVQRVRDVSYEPAVRLLM